MFANNLISVENTTIIPFTNKRESNGEEETYQYRIQTSHLREYILAVVREIERCFMEYDVTL